MITINTKQILLNFKNEPLKDGAGEDAQDLTIGTAISSILAGQVSNPTLGWQLGKKFATEDNVNLKAEEVVFIKKELESNKGWPAITIGQLIDILENGKSK